jgi:hypothetical protein
MAENSRVTNGANLVALLALSEPWPIARSDWFGNGPALPQAALAASRHEAAQPPLPTFTWGNSASLAAKPANGIAALSLTADAPATAPSLTAPQSPLGSAGTASFGNPAAAESVSAGNAAVVNAPAAAIPVDWPPSTTTGPPAPDMSRPAGAGSSGATAVAGPEPVAAAAISPAPSVSFPGASFATNQTMPPDSNIAVGLTQVVTTENSRIQWYDRSGKLQSDTGLSAFFGLPVGTPMVDTRVVYDSVNNRFVVVSDQVQDHILRLAVSKDSDPNHGWWFAGINGQVTVNGQNTWADFPGLATDGKAIYITARMNTFGPDGVINTGDETFAETHLWIVNDGIGANGIYDGGSLLVSDFGANAVTGGSTNNFGQPAQILSPTGGSLGTFLVNATITGRVQITRIDNATTAPSFQSQNLVGAPSVSFPLVANQPGTFAQIEAHTVGNAVWRNGALYAVGVIGPASGPNFGLPTAHWYKIDTSNLASLSLVDQGDVGGSLLGSGPGVATFQPMISADPAGDFLVNFSASGPGLFAGAYYAVHTTADAAGTVETPQALHVGQDSYALADSAGDIRWGDYSGIAADPANPNTVWVFNQYAAPRGPGQTGNWATQAAAVPLVPGPMPLAGGRWVFSPPAGFGGLILGINNGAAPIFPPPVAGAFNIEVFTSPSLSGQPGIPNPDANFQSSIADPGGTLDSGFLTGTDLRLTTGDLLLVDSVTGSTFQSPSKLTLGSGNQTVVGARSDTLVGGSGNQILSALAGSETVVGGTGNVSVWGGANDSIVGGTGANQQIVLTGSLTTVAGGMAGNATIASAAQDTILSLGGSTQNIVIAGGVNSLVDLTGNSGLDAVIGATGDTIIAGAGTTNVEGVNGGMLIVVGAAGTTNISGSGVPGLGNTITGGSGNLDFNPSAQPGQGDLFNLSGSTGNATINAFGFGSARIASPDTILAGNGADSVFGGAGDRIGTGNGPSVGGVHLWDHSDPLAGASLAFGSNDTVASTAYNTAAHIATRHPEIAGSSTAVVTVTNFNTTTDSLFYQNENTATTDAIIATSQAATIAGAASTVLTLPDGTLMTLVGITQAQLIPALFKP